MKIFTKLNALAVILVSTFALATIFKIDGPNSEIVKTLELEKNSKVLYIASYNDFYKFDVNDYSRSILGRRLALVGETIVEGNYEEILSRASLGVRSFLQYLQANNVTHLLIPKATYSSSRIFHRWSNHGTIDIPLDSEQFVLEASSSGENSLVLLKVIYNYEETQLQHVPKYEIKWSGVRKEFYELKRSIKEDYFTTYERAYPERIDVSWVLKGESVKFQIDSESDKQIFKIELKFIAAYGDKAPPQILQIVSGTQRHVISLFPSKIKSVVLEILPGNPIEISNVLGCNQGINFDPEGYDPREFCYGLTDVNVSLFESE